MRTPLFLLALASASLLPAQDKGSPFRFVPADVDGVLRIAAPAKWKQQFAKTQVSKLFSGTTLGPMTAAMGKQMDQSMAQLRESGEFDADLLESLWANYQGDIVLAASVDFAGLPAAMQEDGIPSFGLVIALTPDGTYDFGKLAAEMQKRIEDSADSPLRDLQIGEHRFRCSQNEDESAPDATLPTVVAGHLLMLVSDDLEKFGAKVLGESARFAAASSDGAMFAHMELGPLMKAITELAGDFADAPVDVEPILQALGMNSLDTFTMSFGADGKHVAGHFDMQLKDGDKGLMSMFLGGEGAPKMLRAVPANAETFSVGPMNLGTLYTTVAKVWTAMGDQVPMSWEDAQTAFAEEMKVRLKEDLIDHLGGEWLTVQDLAAGLAGAIEEDEENPLAAFEGSCFGIQLRDGKAFGESLEKMLRARGLHASRKTEDYQGMKLHRLRLAGVAELEYAVADDMLLVSLGNGEASRQSMRSVLDARANPAAAGELPAAVKDHLGALPGGWSGLSAMSMSAWCTGMASAFDTAFAAAGGMGEAPPELEMILGTMKGIGGELERFGLKTIISTTYTKANGVVARFRW